MGRKSSLKNSINESVEKKPPKSNYSYLTEGVGGIEFDNRNYPQIDGSRENVILGKAVGGTVFAIEIIPKDSV